MKLIGALTAGFLFLAPTASPVVAQGMPESIRETLEESFVGEWDTTASYEGETTKGRILVEWAADKNCVIIKGFSADGKNDSAGLLGWVPEEKAVVHHSFGLEGDHFTITWSEFSEDEWKGRVSGNVNGREDESAASVHWRGDSIEYRDTTLGKPFVIKAVRREGN